MYDNSRQVELGDIITLYQPGRPDYPVARTVVEVIDPDGLRQVRFDHAVPQDFLPDCPMEYTIGRPYFRARLANPTSYSWILSRAQFEDEISIDFVEDIAGVLRGLARTVATHDFQRIQTNGDYIEAT